MGRRYDWLLFDADDTLFDFGAGSRAAILEVLVGFGIEPHPVTVACYEAVNAMMWRRGDLGELNQTQIAEGRFFHFLACLGRSDIDHLEMNAAYKATLAKQSVLFKGALEMVRGLHEKGYRMAIVTNGLAQVQHGRLDESPIRRFFEGLFISEEVGARKPQPEMFDAVCERLGIDDRSRAVMIGDNLQSDILGGNLAKIDTIWYNYNLATRNNEIIPGYEVSNYEALVAVIEGET